MKDRDRLLDGSSTELERLLLSAVAQERPSGALQRRMRAGLGFAGSVITFKAALAAASVAAIAVAATVATSGNEPQPSPVLPAAPARALPREKVEARVPPPAESAPELVASNAPPAIAAPVRAPTTAPVTRALEPARGDIREQMQLLEQARASLRSGDDAAGLARLSEYQQRYPRGVFGQEASVLRIEALHRMGDETRARALAQAFVGRHPASPHVERLSRILSPRKTER